MTNTEAVATPGIAPKLPTERRVKFQDGDSFHKALRARVDRYFRMTGRSPRDSPRMYVKTAITWAWCLASYVLLVFFATAWWQSVPLAISLALAVTAIAFNVQHDGGHQSYSKKKWINRVMASALDVLGGSSYIWNQKHNLLHHTYANIAGHDDDIELGVLGRLSPHQRHLFFHRAQHIYLWVLYGFLPVKWHLFDDFFNVARGRIGTHKFPRPRGLDLFIFVGGKAVFFSLAFVIPALFHPLWVVVLFYLLACQLEGMILSVVFQLAHVVEEADFPLPDEDTNRMGKHWAVHQVESTVDFARRNRLLSWYVGGLNFQIEHHLFPRICHVHYPRIARLVENTSRRFGVRYSAHRTFAGGVASHFRWLHRMGQA